MKRLDHYTKYYGPKLYDSYKEPMAWEYKEYRKKFGNPVMEDTLIFTDRVDHQFRDLIEQ